MKRLILQRSVWVGLVVLATGSAACDVVQGLRPATLDTGGGGTTSTGGSGGTTTAGGVGGASPCEPGTSLACYTGMPPTTKDTAECHGGMRSCKADGSGYEEVCEGEVTPMLETCVSAEDEDCDNLDCALWAASHGDESNQWAGAVATDGAGNYFIAGSFAGTVGFDQAVVGANGTDLYLAKLDEKGNGVWAKSFDIDADLGNVQADSQGNVYLSGETSSLFDFGNGLPGSGIYVSKFAPDGTLVWSANYNDPDAEDYTPGGAAVDLSQSVFVLGTSITIGGATTWVRKYSADGSFAWMVPFATGSITSRFPQDVVVDPFGNAIVTGGFYGAENFDYGGVKNSAGKADAYIVKLSPSGDTVWAGIFGDAADQFGMALGTDSIGNVYWLGQYEGSVDLDAASPPLMSKGDVDLFLVKFSSAKVLLWSRSLGGAGKQMAGGLAVDEDGNVVVTGSTDGPIDFGGGAVPAPGSEAAFIAKFDTDGVPVWNRVFGDGAKQFGRGVAVGADKSPFLAGSMQGKMDVGGAQLTSKGGYDVFVARFAP